MSLGNSKILSIPSEWLLAQDPRAGCLTHSSWLIHFPYPTNQSFTNVPVFEPFMDLNMVSLDFFHSEDLCFMRLIRRGAKNDFVMGSPIHHVLYYNSVRAQKQYQVCWPCNTDHLLTPNRKGNPQQAPNPTREIDLQITSQDREKTFL